MIAIIGILAGVAIPQYGQYAKRAKFTDVIAQTAPYKLAVGLCIQDNNGRDLCDTNYGDLKPATPKGHLASLTVTDGSITATGTSEVGNAVYKLDPVYHSTNNTLTWNVDDTVAGACKGLKLCK